MRWHEQGFKETSLNFLGKTDRVVKPYPTHVVGQAVMTGATQIWKNQSASRVSSCHIMVARMAPSEICYTALIIIGTDFVNYTRASQILVAFAFVTNGSLI